MIMTTTVKHKGTPVTFSDGTLIIPPLSLAFIEENGERLESFTGTLKDVTTVVDCLHAALVRNYPDMKRADVAAMVDFGNMDDVMQAVMARSGLVNRIETDAGKLEATSP
jgi:hypothetical protein